ncbi:MAG: response regulator [Burkholderiales bacterium]|nr:response regulator [Burkholderiales bacterium]
MSNSDRPAKDGPKDQALTTLVYSEQVATLYRLAPFTLVMSVVAATFTWGILDWTIDAVALGGWLLAHHAVILARYLVLRAYARARPAPEAARRWARRFVAGTVATGLVWGLIGTAFRPPEGHALAGVAVVIIVTVGAAGLFTLGQLFTAYCGLVLPLLTPALVALMLSGGAAERSYGIVVGVFLVVAIGNARRGARSFADAIRLRLELARTAEEREQARAAAEAASRAKSQFLANMSHEIRTPMNGIVGMAELIASSRLDDRQRRYIEALHHSAESLIDIVNDILDLSKIEAGRLELAAADFDLRASVAEVIELLRVRAEEKGLALELSFADDVPRHVRADPIRLRQVITNLVGNAIKFSERGSVHVSVARGPSAPAPTLRFEVADSGIGMTPEQSGRIFEAFTQGDASHTRKYGGTGLGLAISRELVELMGGEIGVTTALGIGSTFWFTAAVERAIECDAAEAAALPEPLAPLSGHVLLVEDNELNRVVARGMLEALGLTVSVVADGRDAVREVFLRRYDLVLMDCQMPGLDGFEATQRIRARESATRAPGRATIIALTANAAAGDRERCIAAGMDDYLSKPLHMADLHATAGRWLRQPDSTVPPAVRLPAPCALTSAPASVAVPCATDLAAVDESALDRLRAMQRPGQPDVVTAVVGTFVNRSAALFESLREAIAGNDTAVARRAAHSLKSNCLYVGANNLAALFKRAERAAGDGDLATLGRLATEIAPALSTLRTRLAHTRRCVAPLRSTTAGIAALPGGAEHAL